MSLHDEVWFACASIMFVTLALAISKLRREVEALHAELDQWTRYVIRNGDAIDRGRERAP